MLYIAIVDYRAAGTRWEPTYFFYKAMCTQEERDRRAERQPSTPTTVYTSHTAIHKVVCIADIEM